MAAQCLQQGCNNPTTDPTGKCHHHRGLVLATSARMGSNVGQPPPAPAAPEVLTVAAEDWQPGDGVHPTGGYDTVVTTGNGHQFYQLGSTRHREDGPAVVWADGNQEWYNNGVKHRADGPAVSRPLASSSAREEWYLLGVLHRADGPARTWADGGQEWYWQGVRHRKDGPARVWPDGGYEWYDMGFKHRLDGPAYQRGSDGATSWYVGGTLVDGGKDNQKFIDRLVAAGGDPQQDGILWVAPEGISGAGYRGSGWHPANAIALVEAGITREQADSMYNLGLTEVPMIVHAVQNNIPPMWAKMWYQQQSREVPQ